MGESWLLVKLQKCQTTFWKGNFTRNAMGRFILHYDHSIIRKSAIYGWRIMRDACTVVPDIFGKRKWICSWAIGMKHQPPGRNFMRTSMKKFVLQSDPSIIQQLAFYGRRKCGMLPLFKIYLAVLNTHIAKLLIWHINIWKWDSKEGLLCYGL